MIGTYVNVQAILDHQQQQGEYLREANEQLWEALRLLREKNDDMISHVQVLATTYQAAIDGQRPTDALFNQEKANAAARQEYIDGAASAVQVLSTLLGFANERDGEVAAGVGRAAIQIATAVNNFVPTDLSLTTTSVIPALTGAFILGFSSITGAVRS